MHVTGHTTRTLTPEGKVPVSIEGCVDRRAGRESQKREKPPNLAGSEPADLRSGKSVTWLATAEGKQFKALNKYSLHSPFLDGNNVW